MCYVMRYATLEVEVSAFTYVCLACRLLPGLNLDDFCYKVRKATGKLQSQEQLTEVRQWMWNFTMHAMHLLVQVGLTLVQFSMSVST